jgi:hypothetical protein
LTVSTATNAGISVEGKEAEVVCEDCSIQDNDNYGIQAYRGANCKALRCTFSNFVDIFCTTEARVKCQLCVFQHSKQEHCHVKDGAKMSLKECNLWDGGSAIQVEAAVLKIRGTEIHDQPHTAVLLFKGAVLKATRSTFADNGVSGLQMHAESRAELNQCQFLRNRLIGIQADGGELVLENCAVKNHGQIGILYTPAVILTEVGTEYEDNGVANVLCQ